MEKEIKDNHLTKQILLVGNPNVGKSTIFNALCNQKQKTGNYAGITVSSISGEYVFQDEKISVTDLPGTYSIYPASEDEAISTQLLLEGNYTGVLLVLEALSIKRGLLLFQQIQDLGIPTILVINQIDEAKKRGIIIDFEALEKQLGTKIIQTNGKTGEGISQLKEAIHANRFSTIENPRFEIPTEFRTTMNKENPTYSDWVKWVAEEQSLSSSKRMQVKEAVRRYQNIDTILSGIVSKKVGAKELLTEKIDKILVHKALGYIIFSVLLLLIFQAVFFLAEYPMAWIETLISGNEETEFLGIKGWVAQWFPKGPLQSLVIDGILSGIEGVIVFAPQIFILLFFLAVLEDTGYMARVVFLMDRLLQPFGLNGKSIVPLVSGTACAVPAIMSTRNIENLKERLITILVTPFMACSARLPIYSIIITLIISEGNFMGISYKAWTMFLMYFLGFAMSLISAFILKKIIKSKEKSFLIMDLPTYKMPLWWKDIQLGLSKAWAFITGAGKVIFAVSIILWVLSYFGPKQNNGEIIASDVALENSYLSKVGAVIQPVVEPLGYDWKMGIGVLTSFAARETFVGTIAILYGLEEDVDVESEEGGKQLLDKMRADTYPDGRKVFSFATGLSILMFYAFSMQCISTIAIVYKETKSLKWTMVQLLGMTGIAYIAAFLVYQMFK